MTIAPCLPSGRGFGIIWRPLSHLFGRLELGVFSHNGFMSDDQKLGRIPIQTVNWDLNTHPTDSQYGKNDHDTCIYTIF